MANFSHERRQNFDPEGSSVVLHIGRDEKTGELTCPKPDLKEIPTLKEKIISAARSTEAAVAIRSIAALGNKDLIVECIPLLWGEQNLGHQRAHRILERILSGSDHTTRTLVRDCIQDPRLSENVRMKIFEVAANKTGTDSSWQDHAIEIAESFGIRKVEALSHLLHSRNGKVHSLAAIELGKCGADAMDPLLNHVTELMRDQVNSPTIKALDAFLNIWKGEEEFLDRIQDICAYGHPYYSKKCFNALLEHSRYSQQVRNLEASDNKYFRFRSALVLNNETSAIADEAIGYLGEQIFGDPIEWPSAVEPALEILKHWPRRNLVAVVKLSALGFRELDPVLLDIAESMGEDSTDIIANVAAGALNRQYHSFRPNDEDTQTLAKAKELLLSFGDNNYPNIRSILERTNQWVQTWALSLMGDPVPYLESHITPLLTAQRSMVREAAVKKVGEYLKNFPDAAGNLMPEIFTRLNDARPRVAVAAANVLKDLPLLAKKYAPRMYSEQKQTTSAEVRKALFEALDKADGYWKIKRVYWWCNAKFQDGLKRLGLK